MLKNILPIIVIIVSQISAGQITRIDPPNWWVDMKYDTVQLMLYGSDLAGLAVTSGSPHIDVLNIHLSENHRYGFIDIYIHPNAIPGIHPLNVVTNEHKSDTIYYELTERQESQGRYQGFDCNDIVYLITPDRFVNGDPGNDYIENMRSGLPPESMNGRHGGDIKGIVGKLDYLKDLGITSIWINPLVENDMPISYHGYAATDLYSIDPRFGTNMDYYNLVEKAHEKGIKVIMDHVVNHIGLYHPWMASLPDSSWLNGSIEHHDWNRHQKEVLFDPYADSLEIKNLLYAWFVDIMPDLNQKNEFLAKYLIQNTLWWIESAGIDGIREDTYPYADAEFLSRWANIIIQEYAEFKIVGEVWIHDPVFIAPFQANSRLSSDLNTNLPSVTDFGLFEAFGRVFNRDQDISEFYSILGKDFLYPDPNNLLTFIDNHDVMRLMDLVDRDLQRYIMALKMLFTIRGIPQIYYGTEIGLTGGKHHGEIRRDFPGGFPEDTRDAFTAEGRSEVENMIFEKLKALIEIRKRNHALSCGRTIHFSTIDNFSLYIREHENEKMLIVVNNSENERNHSLSEYFPYLQNRTILKNVESGQEYPISEELEVKIPGYDVGIFELVN